MTEQEYRQHPAVSRSELFRILDSPEKFRYFKDNPEPPTPALLFGQLFHAMALQPETVSEQFVIDPKISKKSNAGKDEWKAFLEENKDKTIVTSDMYQQATEMCEALSRNEFVQKLLKGEKEKVFFWDDDLTGEPCKCRVDCISEVKDICAVVDLKSAAKADVESFVRDAIKYGYDFQSAMYTEGVQKNIGKKCIFVFIVIEKEPPYAVNIFQADPVLMRRGGDLFREAMGIYHDCNITGNWYGYLGKYNMINNLALPAWLAKEYE